MVRLGILTIFLGIGLLYSGIDQVCQAWGASAIPEQLRLDEFLQRGSRNRHVEITDFGICRHFIVKGRPDLVPLKDGYIVIWPREPGTPVVSERPPPGAGVAIVKDNAVSAEFLTGTKPIRGLVSRTALNPAIREKLAQQFPGVTLDSVPVIEAGREPPPLTQAWLYIGVSAVLVLGPLAVAYRRLRCACPN